MIPPAVPLAISRPLEGTGQLAWHIVMTETVDRRAEFESRVMGIMDRMYGTALRFTRNSTDAEDLVADTLVKSWKSFDTLDEMDRFEGWIMRILSNTYISKWRRQKTHNRIFDEDAAADDLDDSQSLYARLHQPFLLWYGTPEQDFVNGLLNEDIEKALDSLSEGYRLVLMLVEILGFSYEEASAELRVPVGTVRSRLNRARRKMQDALWHHALDAELVSDPSP